MSLVGVMNAIGQELGWSIFSQIHIGILYVFSLYITGIVPDTFANRLK